MNEGTTGAGANPTPGEGGPWGEDNVGLLVDIISSNDVTPGIVCIVWYSVV